MIVAAAVAVAVATDASKSQKSTTTMPSTLMPAVSSLSLDAADSNGGPSKHAGEDAMSDVSDQVLGIVHGGCRALAKLMDSRGSTEA